jgi:hypothetical protein
MLDPQKKLDAPTLLLIGGIIFWIALYAIIGPQALGTSGFDFKDPGINLAIGKGLREVATHANPSLEYKYYANYPPVYPFLYGLYVSVVGIGDYQNTYFDLLLHIAKAILIFMIVVRYGTDWTPNQKLIITGILVLFLPSANSHDRPEDLVIVLFLVSLLFYLQRQPEAVFLVAGLNLMTSPVCGLISAVILLGIYFHDVFKEKVDWKIFSEKSYPVLYMLVFPVIIIAILAFFDTSIFERFYDFVKYTLVKDRPKVVEYVKLKRALSVGLFHGIAPLLSFVLIVLLGLVASFSAYRALEKRLALFMIAVIGMVIFLNLQGRSPSYEFFTVLGLTVGMYVMMKDVEKVREMRRKVFWVCLGIILLMTLPRTARDIYVRLVPMSSERYKDAKEQIKNFFKDKPDEFILSSYQHFFIVKSVKQKVVASELFSADEPNIPRYIVATPTEKDSIITLTPNPKIFTPKVEKAFFYRKVFETEKSVPNPQNTFWERLLMRPHETWYPVIYERIDEQ